MHIRMKIYSTIDEEIKGRSDGWGRVITVIKMVVIMVISMFVKLLLYQFIQLEKIESMMHQ